MIDHQSLIDRSLRKPGVTLQYPFDPDLPVLFVGLKMFALLGGTGSAQSAQSYSIVYAKLSKREKEQIGSMK